MIGLGIIGCGDVAFRTYFPGLQALAKQAYVAACFDPALERADRAAALFSGARAVKTLDELLADDRVGAVVNLTPAPAHAEVTAQALEADRHVYSEKPLALTLADADRLIELSESRGKLLLCAPAVLATIRFRWLRELIERGEIGRPTLALGQLATMGPAAWREYTGDPRVHYTAGVGPLLDLGVYVLHAVTGVLGPARRVEAFSTVAVPDRDVLIERLAGEKIEVAADDQALLHLDFGGGALGHVMTSFTAPGSRVPVLEVHGTEGAVSIPLRGWYDADGPVELLRAERGRWRRATPPARSRYRHLLMVGIPHLVDCVEDGQEPVLTAAHARHVLEIVLAAARSSREERAVALETRF